MHEASDSALLGARRARWRWSGYDPSFEAVPDLVVVDGGKGQLGAAVAALTEAGCWRWCRWCRWPSARRRSSRPGRPSPSGCPSTTRVCFSCSGCATKPTASPWASTARNVRRSTTLSLLDQLPGVGEKRKKAIVQHFGSPERFLQASREELEAVPGLPGKVARDIHAYVHKTG